MTNPPPPVVKNIRLDASLSEALGIVAVVDRRSVTQTINVLLWEALTARVVLGNAPAEVALLVEEHNRTLGIEG